MKDKRQKGKDKSKMESYGSSQGEIFAFSRSAVTRCVASGAVPAALIDTSLLVMDNGLYKNSNRLRSALLSGYRKMEAGYNPWI